MIKHSNETRHISIEITNYKTHDFEQFHADLYHLFIYKKLLTFQYSNSVWAMTETTSNLYVSSFQILKIFSLIILNIFYINSKKYYP